MMPPTQKLETKRTQKTWAVCRTPGALKKPRTHIPITSACPPQQKEEGCPARAPTTKRQEPQRTRGSEQPSPPEAGHPSISREQGAGPQAPKNHPAEPPAWLGTAKHPYLREGAATTNKSWQPSSPHKHVLRGSWLSKS